MVDLERKVFAFTWGIKNFSMCPQPFGKWIYSPIFSVDFLENTEWKLRMYPKGETDSNYVSVFLERTDVGEYAKDITIAFSLEALSTQNGKGIKNEVQKKTLRSGGTWGFDKFCARVEMFKNENGLLLNDTFTLRCGMGRCMEQQKNKDAPQYPNTDALNFTLSTGRHQGSARTKIKVTHTSFVWPIEIIGELPCDHKISTSVPFVIKSKHSFDVFLKLTDDSEGDKDIQVEIHKKNTKGKSIFARCRIKTVEVPSKDQFQEKGEYYFEGREEDEIWIFPIFLKMKQLRENYLKHTYGILYLRFDLLFSSNHDVLHFENISERFPLYIKGKETPYPSASNFEKLYEDGEFVDATLRVRDREFKVHKLVLSAESNVFRRMFLSGMNEQNSGVVDIDDIDPDTVERLVKYMYSHKLDELNSKDARKLYLAADKYNITDLKCRLRTYLTTYLCVNSVCETLILSDAHQDEDLKAAVIDFISSNSNEIFYSKNWEDFTDVYGRLAARTMLKILTKRVSPFFKRSDF